MTIALYGCRGCGSAAIEIGLAIAGVPFELVESASTSQAAKRPAFRRANPLRQVPTLVFDDGTVMSESAAILIELGLRHPEGDLLSSDARERARQIRGLVYIAANCYAAIGILDYPGRWYERPGAAARQAMAARGRTSLYGLWAVFADTFPATPYLSGARLGALDALAVVVSRWSGARSALAESRPAFRALLGRIEDDPRVAAVVARHWRTTIG